MGESVNFRWFFDSDTGALWRYNTATREGAVTRDGVWITSDKPYDHIYGGRGYAEEITESEADTVHALLVETTARLRSEGC